MSILNITYYVILGMNFIFSMIYKRSWKNLFPVYLGITIVVEALFAVHANFVKGLAYNCLDVVSIGYFGYLYFEETRKSIVIKGICLFFIVLSGICIFISKTDYSIFTGYFYCLFLIFISLFWMYQKITEDHQEDSILNLSFFWLSISLLFWSVFYIFRMFPMYYFNNEDKGFLIEIAKVFTLINIVTYLLFMRSLFCKR